MKVQVPWRAWYGDTVEDLDFPAGWRVDVARMPGGQAMGAGAIERALREPVGTPPLRDLAHAAREGGQGRAVIVVEDITRPLDTAPIVAAVIAELRAGGLDVDDIWITIGQGAHTPMDRADLVKKLGSAVVARHLVYQNQPYEHCDFLGTTQRGTPVFISRFYLDADLRIAIGTVTPHPYAGFGGGAKTVAVGVAGIDTLHANHGRAYSTQPPSTAVVDDNPCRDDMVEIARMAGLAFSINGVVNGRRETVGLFAGDLVEAHAAAVALARQVSSTQLPDQANVAVFNAYPKDANLLQSINALNAISYDLRNAIQRDGTPVLAAACPQGAGINFLESVGMRLYLKFTREMMGLGAHGAILFSPNLSYPEVKSMYPDDTLVLNRWEEVVEELVRRHGEHATATVFPTASLQIPA